MTTELPPLPEPEICAIGSLDMREDVFGYSGDQMRAYAIAAVAVERERCARICERQYDIAHTITGAARALACADAIRKA